MKRATFSFALVVGLAALSSCGAQQHASEPSAVSESDESVQAPEGEGAAPAALDEEEAPSFDDEETSATGPSGETEASVDAGETKADEAAGQCRQSSAKLALSVDRPSIRLEQGVLEASMDGPICKISMTIMRKDGSPIELSFPYTSARRELKWKPLPRDEIEKIEVRISADHGAYQAVTIVPWSVKIDHREVVFDTNKADIRPSEVPSLDDSLSKINKTLKSVEGKGLGTITLFIAGHTDTRGSATRNLDLSRRRAQSIASWFMKRGLCVPIAFEGFGETVLKKMTADEVDEQANRRVDYILAVEPPAVGKGLTPAWKWLSKGC